MQGIGDMYCVVRLSRASWKLMSVVLDSRGIKFIKSLLWQTRSNGSVVQFTHADLFAVLINM